MRTRFTFRLWSVAMEGDVPPANAGPTIIDKRIRLLGLDMIEQESAGSRTVALTPAQLAEWGD